MCFGYLLIIPENKVKCPIDLIHPPINILILVNLFGSLENATIHQESCFMRKQDYVTVHYSNKDQLFKGISYSVARDQWLFDCFYKGLCIIA